MLNSREEMGLIVDIAWLQHQLKQVLEASVLLGVPETHVAIPSPSLSLRVVMEIPLLLEERSVSLIRVLNMLHFSQVMPVIAPMVTTHLGFVAWAWGITGLLIV
jgi:hypothetical protein